MKLFLVERRQVFAKSIAYILLVEEDVYSGERCVVGSHAVILQILDGVHSGLGHIVLCEHRGQLFGAVVSVVEEYHGVALLDRAVDSGIMDRLYKFVGDVIVVALLHGRHHIGGLLSLAVDEEIIGDLHAFPALVAIHRVVATHNRCDLSGRFGAMSLQSLDESFCRCADRCRVRP